MTLLANINVGSSPNDGTGDSLRTSFTKCNDNFQILDALATQFVAGNLVGNVTSTGTSTFNTLNGNVITSNLFSGNGSALTNVAAATANIAALATQVTGNTQANITTVGTLGNLTVSGTILTDIIEGATIGNSGALLTGTLTTASQPNVTSLGALTELNFVGNSQITDVNIIQHTVLNFIDNTSITDSSVTFNANVPSTVIYDVAANLTLSYVDVAPGILKHVYVKNFSGATRHVVIPNSNNNKGTNVIPISNSTVASFKFIAFDDTEGNVVVTITND